MPQWYRAYPDRQRRAWVKPNPATATSRTSAVVLNTSCPRIDLLRGFVSSQPPQPVPPCATSACRCGGAVRGPRRHSVDDGRCFERDGARWDRGEEYSDACGSIPFRFTVADHTGNCWGMADALRAEAPFSLLRSSISQLWPRDRRSPYMRSPYLAIIRRLICAGIRYLRWPPSLPPLPCGSFPNVDSIDWAATSFYDCSTMSCS